VKEHTKSRLALLAASMEVFQE